MISPELGESVTATGDFSDLKLSHYFVCMSHGIMGEHLTFCLSFLLMEQERAFSSCKTLNIGAFKLNINRKYIKD